MKTKWKIILIGLAASGGIIGILYLWPYVFLMGGVF